MNTHKKNLRSRYLDLLTPRRSPNSALPLHTQKQCTARVSSWGSSIPVSDTKGSWIHLWGEGCQASRQLSVASTPVLHYTVTGLHNLLIIMQLVVNY